MMKYISGFNYLIPKLEEVIGQSDIREFMNGLFLLRYVLKDDDKGNDIFKNGGNREIRKIINEHMKHLKFSDIIKFDYEDGRISDELFDMSLKIFDCIPLDNLHNSYVYALSRVTPSDSISMGEFYTPLGIANLLVQILNPHKGSIYDPCCGSGSLLFRAAEHLKESGHNEGMFLFGHEKSEQAKNICKINLLLAGLDATIEQADILDKRDRDTMKYDSVITNPPFNLTKWFSEYSYKDERWEYGAPSKKYANFAFLQHCIYSLKEDGRAAILLTNSALEGSDAKDATIRRNLTEKDLIEAIVSLPSNLFYSTPVPASIWVINKNKKNKNKTLFINVAKIYTKKTFGKHRAISEEGIRKLCATFDMFRNGNLKCEPGFCKVVCNGIIKEQKFSLNPSLYMGLDSIDSLFSKRKKKIEMSIRDLQYENIKNEEKINDLMKMSSS